MVRMDPLQVLPLELSLNVLEFLDAFGLGMALQASPLWQRIIDDHDMLWAQHCRQFCHSEYIKRDRQAGFTWKETLIRNYGSKQLLRDWISGAFNLPKCYHQLPPRPICRFDANDWGDIIDAQFARDSAKNP